LRGGVKMKAKFLLDLSHSRDLRGFAGFDLAAGKLPKSAVLFAQPSPLQQNPASLVDQRHRDDEQRCREILQVGLSR
jgi:hypothetical protein